LETAITIHDCQLKRSRMWTVYVPIAVAVITGLFLMPAAVFKK
jgi:hypothetical protein